MINYSTLHIETLEIILKMHVQHRVELLAEPEVLYRKVLGLERTIARVKAAISIKH